MAEEVKTTTNEAQEPEEELVSIRLPVIKENNADVFVRVNHRTWLIKRGETVKVPKCVVEVLHNAEQAQLEAFEYEAKAQKKIKSESAK